MGTKLFLIAAILLATFTDIEPRMYTKTYHDNGRLESEGWVEGDKKTKYWKFYHPNGVIASEGHYKNNRPDAYWHYYNENGKLIKEGHYKAGKAQNWWIFYDLADRKMTKTQYTDNQKDGFSLIYLSKKLTKVIKYDSDVFAGEWTSVRSFYRDNPDVSIHK